MHNIFNLSTSAIFIRSSGELLQEYKGHTCKVSLNSLAALPDIITYGFYIDHLA
jgi:hypothetical protein